MRQLSDRRVNNRYKIGRYPETVQTSCPYIIAHQDPFVKYLFNKYFHFYKKKIFATYILLTSKQKNNYTLLLSRC